MWADINAKPKQGIVYRVFRGHVIGIPADCKDFNYASKAPAVLMPPLTKEQLASQECVGGDAKRLRWTPIKLMHASGNACVSKISNASGNTCISRHSLHTLANDGPKKEVQSVVDVEVPAPPGELQQAPLIMVSGCAWSSGVY
jgi:hypothetical protein